MEVLDYHKLKIFKTVADVKSFSKAAELLFLTQPTVTFQIKKLENYLNVTLFKRDKSGITLTPEGEILYEYASKIIDDYIEMEKVLSVFKNRFEKYINIGVSSTIGDYLIPPFIAKFEKKFPDVKINIFIGNSKEVEDGVLSKNFYVGLIEDDIESNKLVAYEFFDDEIVLVAANNADIPDKIKKEDIKNYKFIFRERGSGTRNITEKYLKEKGIKINPIMEVSSSKSIAEIVANSNLLGFVSKLVAKEGIENGKLKEVKLDDVQIKRKFLWITQKNIRLPKLEREFLNMLLEDAAFQNSVKM